MKLTFAKERLRGRSAFGTLFNSSLEGNTCCAPHRYPLGAEQSTRRALKALIRAAVELNMSSIEEQPKKKTAKKDTVMTPATETLSVVAERDRSPSAGKNPGQRALTQPHFDLPEMADEERLQAGGRPSL